MAVKSQKRARTLPSARRMMSLQQEVGHLKQILASERLERAELEISMNAAREKDLAWCKAVAAVYNAVQLNNKFTFEHFLTQSPETVGFNLAAIVEDRVQTVQRLRLDLAEETKRRKWSEGIQLRAMRGLE